MKKIIRKMGLVIISLALIGAITSCKKEQESEIAQDIKEPTAKETGYAFGVIMGLTLNDLPAEFDTNSIIKGIKAALADDTLDPKKYNDVIQAAFAAGQKKIAEKNKEEEKKFLEENVKKEGIKTTASGLQYEVLSEGSGKKPTIFEAVTMHYTGMLTDGKFFDSSLEKGEPITIPLNQIGLLGWAEGIQLMTKGARYKFYIPSDLAYGENGIGKVIPPNATLIFEVELLDIIAEKDIAEPTFQFVEQGAGPQQ